MPTKGNTKPQNEKQKQACEEYKKSLTPISKPPEANKPRSLLDLSNIDTARLQKITKGERFNEPA